MNGNTRSRLRAEPSGFLKFRGQKNEDNAVKETEEE